MTTEELIAEYSPWNLRELCARCGCHIGWHDLDQCNTNGCECKGYVFIEHSEQRLGPGWQDRMAAAISKPSNNAIAIHIEPAGAEKG